jgi:hypothetical protein
MSIKISDLLHRDAQTERWFHWAPEDARHLKIEVLLKVCPPKVFRKITEKHTKRVFSRLARGHVEETDNEAAANEVIENHVIGWRGITVEKIRQLVMTKETELGDDQEIEFSVENLTLLIQELPDFGAWVISTVTNVRNFNEPTKEDELKNS